MNLICIACPRGCHLTVTGSGNNLVVKGNKCIKGIEYAKEETADPKRIVTCVVPTDNDSWPVVSVKTDKAIAKKYILTLLKEIYLMKIKLPVKRDDVIISDYKKSGVNIVVTRTLPPLFKGGD